MRDHLYIASVLLIVTTSMNSGGTADPQTVVYGPHEHLRNGIMALIRSNRASDLVSFPRTGRSDHDSKYVVKKLGPQGGHSDRKCDDCTSKEKKSARPFPPRPGRSDHQSDFEFVPDFSIHGPRAGRMVPWCKEVNLQDCCSKWLNPSRGRRSDLLSNLDVLPRYQFHGPRSGRSGRKCAAYRDDICCEQFRYSRHVGQPDLQSYFDIIPDFSNHDLDYDAPFPSQMPQMNQETSIATFMRPNRASGLVSFPRTGRSDQQSDSGVILDFDNHEADTVRDAQQSKSQQQRQYHKNEFEKMSEAEGNNLMMDVEEDSIHSTQTGYQDKKTLEKMCQLLQCDVNFVVF